MITLPMIKQERILEAAREKETVTYKGVPIRLSADFSKETLQARRGWKEVFQFMKGKGLHPRLLYPAKLSFRVKGKIKCFSDKVKLKEFIITKPFFSFFFFNFFCYSITVVCLFSPSLPPSHYYMKC